MVAGPVDREVRHCLGHGGIVEHQTGRLRILRRERPYTDRDPIGIGVVEHWRPDEEGIDWMVYAHRACLLSRLTEDVREGVDW